MTAPLDTLEHPAVSVSQETAAEDRASCPACPHPMAAHDPIGARFCRATAVGAFERGCVCRGG